MVRSARRVKLPICPSVSAPVVAQHCVFLCLSQALALVATHRPPTQPPAAVRSLPASSGRDLQGRAATVLPPKCVGPPAPYGQGPESQGCCPFQVQQGLLCGVPPL